MPAKAVTVTFVVAALLSNIGCRSPYAADRGAMLGAVGGAGVGALVGADRDQELAGALVGSAVGSLAGAVAGTAIDNQRAAERQASVPAPVRSAPPTSPTVDDVVRMTQAGLSSQVISHHLHTNGLSAAPSSSDLVYLKRNGVSDEVLLTMQQLAVAPPTVAAVPVVEPQPIVIEQHVLAPRIGVPRRRYCPPPRRHCSDFSWGISFSNR